MPKTRNPLLSLEAHGTIADTLTFQGTSSRKISRSKPALPYFLTLPAQYQRWLYEDYCHLWRQQSDATRSAYRTSGIRHHLTGFQYWMKYHLTNLPDIKIWYKLDDTTHPTTPDSSRYADPATIIGASPATGPISGALSFDGINDRLQLPIEPQLYIPADDFTWMFFLSINNTTVPQQIYEWRTNGTNEAFMAHYRAPPRIIWRYITDNIAVLDYSQAWTPVAGQYYHMAFRRSGNNWHVFVDGSPLPLQVADFTIQEYTLPQMFARSGLDTYGEISLDNIRLYNRALGQTEISRHSGRRWPPQ